MVLFLPHGSPMFALHPGEAGRAFRAWSAQQPMPRAILIMSPHWMTRGLQIGTAARPETLHDFSGFDPELYQMRYPAPGAPELVDSVLQRLSGAGLSVGIHNTQPLDHGIWTPLMHLYPEADVPVMPISMPLGWGPESVYALGQALSSLQLEEVLLVGTGNLTHNLMDFQILASGGQVQLDYLSAFADWMGERLLDRDDEALLDYRNRAPHARHAHPTEEHLLPLFFALGAAGPRVVPTVLHRGVQDQVLVMNSYSFS